MLFAFKKELYLNNSLLRVKGDRMSRSRARRYRRLLRKMRTVDSYNSKVLKEIQEINPLMNDVLLINTKAFHFDLINNLSNELESNSEIICYHSIIPDIQDDIRDEEDDDD